MLKDDPDAAWERWAKTDPYFAVLTSDKYHADRMDDRQRREFFASGDKDVERILRICQDRFGGCEFGSALDLGCGVGRLVIPLAKRFDTVVGVDVSPSMLELCRANCAEHGCGHVELALSDDDLSRVDGEFDLVHSYIVLQHIVVPKGLKLIRALMGKTKKGGILAIHVPIHRRAGIHRKVSNYLRRNLRPVNHVVNILFGRRGSEPLMQMNVYKIDDIISLGHELGFLDFFLYFGEPQSSFIAPIIFARRG
jgi:SAM-dependent methyltransferase